MDQGGVDLDALRAEMRRIWDGNATFWDGYFAEGNAFHEVLVEPAVDSLLAIRPEEHVLEVGCGNGDYARHLATLGTRVLATDFSATFERARERTVEHAGRVEYQQVDATDEAHLLALDEGSFDAAVSNMALMGMPAVEPLFAALCRLLRAGGRFIFSVMHPCFNTSGSAMVVEEGWARDGTVDTRYAMKVTRYLGLQPAKGTGIFGQPEPHYYFQRPLRALLGAAFRSGLILDGIEEPAFPPSTDQSRMRSLTWQNYTEIPPVLVARLRPNSA